MGDQLSALLNVTIHYPGGKPSFWDLLSGRIKKIVVRFDKMEIPAQFIGQSYDQSDEYRLAFQQWVNQLWEDKDAQLVRLHAEYPA